MPERNAKILVVDDQEVGRQLLESFLIKEGYDVLFAENGEDAIKRAVDESPDLILMDVMMPKIDGFEATRLLRTEHSKIDIPVILVTALDDRDSRLKGLEVGADEYITKPIDRVELLTRIKNLLQLTYFRKNPEIENESKDVSTGSAEKMTISDLVQLNKLLHELYHKEFNYILQRPSSSNYSFCHHSLKEKELFLFVTNKQENHLLNHLLSVIYRDVLASEPSLSPKDISNVLLKQIAELSGFENEIIELILIEVSSDRSLIKFCGINANIIIFNNRKWNDLNGMPMDKLSDNVKSGEVTEIEIQLQKDENVFLAPHSTMNQLDYSSLMQSLRNLENKQDVNISPVFSQLNSDECMFLLI